MKAIRNLRDVVAARGICLRGEVEVNGHIYVVESDGKTSVQIIDTDDDCRCETRKFEGKTTVFKGGERVTENWTDEDEKQFNSFVFWTPSWSWH